MEGLSIKKKLIHCPNKRAKIRICMKQNTAKKKSAVLKTAKTALAKAKKTAKTAVKAVKKTKPAKTKPAAKKSVAVKKKTSNVKKATPKAVVKKAIAKKSAAKQPAKKAKAAKAAKPVAKAVNSKALKEKVKAKPKAAAAVKDKSPKKKVASKPLVAKATPKVKVAKTLAAPKPKKEETPIVTAVLKKEKSPAKKKSPAEKPKRLIIEPPQLKSQAAMTGKAVNPVHTDPDAGKPKHKYKKFELEFSINSAHHILFNYVATSTGLKEWFADEVQENGDLFTFVWDGVDQQAQLISVREDHHIRFHWLDLPVGTYFEFKLETDELTGDLALIITDFAEDSESIESGKSLWQTQIDALFHLIGAHS